MNEKRKAKNSSNLSENFGDVIDLVLSQEYNSQCTSNNATTSLGAVYSSVVIMWIS